MVMASCIDALISLIHTVGLSLNCMIDILREGESGLLRTGQAHSSDLHSSDHIDPKCLFIDFCNYATSSSYSQFFLFVIKKYPAFRVIIKGKKNLATQKFYLSTCVELNKLRFVNKIRLSMPFYWHNLWPWHVPEIKIHVLELFSISSLVLWRPLWQYI